MYYTRTVSTVPRKGRFKYPHAAAFMADKEAKQRVRDWEINMAREDADYWARRAGSFEGIFTPEQREELERRTQELHKANQEALEKATRYRWWNPWTW